MLDSMMSKQQKHVQGHCIFCGGKGLSKEHIISEWLTQNLPSANTHFNLRNHFVVDRFANRVVNTPNVRTFQGAFNNRKVRNVCRTCNNGWMSGIVNRARAVVDPMTKDEPVELSVVAQRDLSAWIALTTIMAEFTDNEQMGVPEEDRHSLMTSGEPPSRWVICVGRYGGTSWASEGVRYRHHYFSFDERLLPGPIVFSNAVSKRLQVTTIALRSLFLHCMSSTSGRMVAKFRNYHIPAGVELIWPPRTTAIDWPSKAPLGDADASEIADSIFRVL